MGRGSGDQELFFCGDLSAAGMLEVVQAFAGSDPAQPGPLVPAVKESQTFVCGEKSFLSQVLGVEVVIRQFEADGVDQVLVLIDPSLQLCIRVNPAHLLFCLL